jgi:tetrapyrrole methylase family protein/MazG family protein
MGVPLVDIVGLGPAGPEHTTPAASERLRAAPVVLLRTSRHPAAAPFLAAGARALDRHYDESASFAAAYQAIVEDVVATASAHGAVAYAVPGSPLVLESTVAALRADPRVQVRLTAGMSFLDLAFTRLGVDPVTAGVRLVDAERFAVEAAAERGPLLVSQLWSRAVASEMKLAVETFPATPIVVLQRLGLPDETVTTIPWEDLDRAIEPDHLTCCYVPELAAPVGAELARLDEVVHVLRARCPWDAEQTHASLARHLIEEAYEAAEAIDGLGEVAEAPPERVAHLEEELGDVLFQVFFHAALAGEEGLFTLADVASALTGKLVGRHPHVFAPTTAPGPASSRAQEASWERLKQEEKGRSSLIEGIPPALPALARAAKLEGRARAAGLALDRLPDAFDGGAARALAAAAGADGDEERLGQLLLGLARRAADRRLDPEQALRRAVAAWEEAIRAAEAGAAVALAELSAAERAERWRRAGAG